MVPMTSELYSAPLSKALLRSVGPYATVLFALSFLVMGIFILPFLPETLSKTQSSQLTTPAEPDTDNADSRRWLPKLRIRARFGNFRRHVEEDIIPLLAQRLIIFTLIATVINQLLRTLVLFLMQYMVARFDWNVENVRSMHKYSR
jgi:hypothetical protein